MGRRPSHQECAVCDLFDEVDRWGPPIGNRPLHLFVDRDDPRRGQLRDPDGGREGEPGPDVQAADE